MEQQATPHAHTQTVEEPLVSGGPPTEGVLRISANIRPRSVWPQCSPLTMGGTPLACVGAGQVLQDFWQMSFKHL